MGEVKDICEKTHVDKGVLCIGTTKVLDHIKTPKPLLYKSPAGVICPNPYTVFTQTKSLNKRVYSTH